MSVQRLVNQMRDSGAVDRVLDSCTSDELLRALSRKLDGKLPGFMSEIRYSWFGGHKMYRLYGVSLFEPNGTNMQRVWPQAQFQARIQQEQFTYHPTTIYMETE